MERQLNRVAPRLPVQAMQTHHILAPAATHWRKATCEEIGCLDYHHGWVLPLDGLDEGDIWQARNAGRAYVQQTNEDGKIFLHFEAGQPCFRAMTHRIRVERPELFIVRNGDWRGSDGEQPLRFSGPDAWRDHLGTHLDKINNQFEG
jgi:hypothetical protein